MIFTMFRFQGKLEEALQETRETMATWISGGPGIEICSMAQSILQISGGYVVIIISLFYKEAKEE